MNWRREVLEPVDLGCVSLEVENVVIERGKLDLTDWLRESFEGRMKSEPADFNGKMKWLPTLFSYQIHTIPQPQFL